MVLLGMAQVRYLILLPIQLPYVCTNFGSTKDNYLHEFSTMMILNWDVRDVVRERFTHEIRHFINLYYPDIILLMKTKVNSN